MKIPRIPITYAAFASNFLTTAIFLFMDKNFQRSAGGDESNYNDATIRFGMAGGTVPFAIMYALGLVLILFAVVEMARAFHDESKKPRTGEFVSLIGAFLMLPWFIS